MTNKSQDAAPVDPDAKALKPLVVDLDGTLLKSDLLYESLFAGLGGDPRTLLRVAAGLREGRAALKSRLARAHPLDPATLPYDDVVISIIREARRQGRRVYLASASSEHVIGPIADHLDLFDGWYASSNDVNLAGDRKAACLVAAFGAGGFDYIGDSAADLPVWARADAAIAVRATPNVERRLRASHANVQVIPSDAPRLADWLKLLRVHQYVKNALLFVAIFTSHTFTGPALLEAGLGFVAFSLCASAVYIVNDLVDLGADRGHPTKRDRPLARGAIAPAAAMRLCPLLLVGGLFAALAVSASFLTILAVYLLLTTAYSFYAKRKFMVDVILLASLYTIRVGAGAEAIDVSLSEWLLAFSMFAFLSLALVKRYTELATRLDLNLPDPSSRNYKIGDLPIVLAMAVAAGFNSVTVLTLYTSSVDVHRLYAHPRLLWLICPIIIYLLGRMVIKAHRREMVDDPILFAIRDKVSLAAVVAIGLVMLAAA